MPGKTAPPPPMPPPHFSPWGPKNCSVLNFSQTSEHYHVHQRPPTLLLFPNSSLASSLRALSCLAFAPHIPPPPASRLHQRGSLQPCHPCQSSKKHIWNHTLGSTLSPHVEAPHPTPPPPLSPHTRTHILSARATPQGKHSHNKLQTLK